MLKPLTMWIRKNWKILKEIGIPDHIIFLQRNLYAGQEATVRTRHGTTDWFKIGKGVCQGCILSPCLFKSYAEYIMRNARLDKSQAGIKDCQEKYQQPQTGRWYHYNGRKWRGTKEPLNAGERGEWKSCLETHHTKKLRSRHLVPSPHGKTEKEKVKAVTRFYFPGLQNYYGQWLHPWN